jgi:hypothetical protein
MVRNTVLLAASTLVCLLSSSPALACYGTNPPCPRVACFGDSWAAFACDTLHDELKAKLHENDVSNIAVSGSTAAFWAGPGNQDMVLRFAQVSRLVRVVVVVCCIVDVRARVSAVCVLFPASTLCV